MEDFLHVGKIINVHGIKGEVKILPLTDDPERFYSLNKVYIEKKDARYPLTISKVRIHKNHILASLNEITDRNQAEELKGYFISIERKDAIALAKDQYFIRDLIGVEVYSLTNERVGTITDILQTGPTDIYVIKGNSKEILVPARKEIFKEIDIVGKIARADIPKDLMEL